ncbi:hypothetical protein [Aquimarina litoralis]|uniref:hypothetical protein n=1 Tax=Aquimarina litoralis TaxID=584605 RepID=UPI001C587C17|nr:hypothetical protein [Aquimarina litoralis]MBW1297925.1 hypothetical protein [Aquimarina litoralis]
MRYFFTAVIAFLILSCSHFGKIDEERILNIGQEILNNPPPKGSSYNHPEIRIREGLSNKLIELTDNIKTYELKIKRGDLPKPYGDNKADCILEILTDYQDIGIRLKYQKKYNTYDVLGYITLED